MIVWTGLVTREFKPCGFVMMAIGRWNYFAAFTAAIPHGPSPTLIRRNSLRDFTSTTETSFDAPFAV
jgi:hypothetical protein